MVTKSREDEEIKEEIATLIDGDRIINFSDSVFAFAATLLILKIDLPKIPPHVLAADFYTELARLWPAYAANFISFLFIAYYWRLHHKLFILIKRYNNVLIWLNTVVLIFVSFLPFPIDLFGDYPTIVPVVLFYTVSIALVGYLLLALWIYAVSNHRLVDKTMRSKTIWYHTLTMAVAPVVFTLSLPLLLVDHLIGKISWVFVIVALFVINQFYKSTKGKIVNPEPI